MLISFLVLTGCDTLLLNKGNTEPGNTSYTKIERRPEDGLYLIAANDFHYLARSLNDQGEYVENIARTGDGKVIHYIDPIMKAFTEQVIYHKPDALLVMGDLTYNGEAQSHIDLVKLLEKIEASGIPVGVLPGNHDIEMPFAKSYATGEAVPTDTISYDEFKQLYGQFGYDDAELKDENSFSYMMELNEDTWAVFLDANAEGSRGRIADQTMEWLISSLEEAKSRGKTVISATHQTLLVHNDLFTNGFLIENDSVIRKIYDYYDVRLNLGGHLHLQHFVLDPEGLNELITGAASVQPNNLGHILIDTDLNVTYETEPIDVAGWARKNRVMNRDLLDFAKYSRDFFTSISYNNTKRIFEKQTDLSNREINTLVTFSSEANTDYFCGDLCATCDGLTEDEAYKLWVEKASDMWLFEYMESYLHDPPVNHNSASFSIAPLNTP